MTTNNFQQKYGFKISRSDTFRNEEFGITPEIQNILDRELAKVKKGKRGMVPRLRTLVGRYPRVPQFMNYLSAAYEKAGKKSKAFEVNRKILEVHPDYLFGKINLAKELIFKKEYEKAAAVLGPNLSITDLKPGEDTFHESEILNYYEAVFLYYLEGKEDDKKAQEISEMMEQVDIEHPSTRMCVMELINFRIAKFSERLAARKEYESRSYDKSVQTEEAPAFHFPEIKQLYEQGMHIGHDTLRQLLALPREALIEDLEKVLMDAVYRYEYFSGKYEESGNWDEDAFLFPLHAIFLLTELRSKKSLPVLWEVLRQGNDLNNFWFDDHLTSTLWLDFYLLGNDDPNFLKSCVLEPGVYEFCKCPPIDAAQQIAYHQPQRRGEIIEWYRDAFQHFIAQDERGEPVDPGVAGTMIADAMDLKAKELLPDIRGLFERDLVDTFICGDYEAVSSDLINPKYNLNYKREVHQSIFDRYTDILTTWAGYQPQPDPAPQEEWPAPAEPPAAKLPPDLAPAKPKLPRKVGRNEPCICGSGKKFKRCCIDKYQ